MNSLHGLQTFVHVNGFSTQVHELWFTEFMNNSRPTLVYFGNIDMSEFEFWHVPFSPHSSLLEKPCTCCKQCVAYKSPSCYDLHHPRYTLGMFNTEIEPLPSKWNPQWVDAFYHLHHVTCNACQGSIRDCPAIQLEHDMRHKVLHSFDVCLFPLKFH